MTVRIESSQGTVEAPRDPRGVAAVMPGIMNVLLQINKKSQAPVMGRSGCANLALIVVCEECGNMFGRITL